MLILLEVRSHAGIDSCYSLARYDESNAVYDIDSYLRADSSVGESRIDMNYGKLECTAYSEWIGGFGSQIQLVVLQSDRKGAIVNLRNKLSEFEVEAISTIRLFSRWGE